MILYRRIPDAEVEEALDAIRQVLALDPRGLIHGRGQFSLQKENTSVENGSHEQSQSEPLPHPDAINFKKKNQKKVEESRMDRTDFAMRFDTLDLRFSPHKDGERKIVIHEIELVEKSC